MRGYLKQGFAFAVIFFLLSTDHAHSFPYVSKKIKICTAVLSLVAVPAAIKWGPKYVIQGRTYLENRAPWNSDWKGVRSIRNGTLTPFWAQEIIGADLRPNLQQFKSSPRYVSIATMSGAYDYRLIDSYKLDGDIESVFQSISPDLIPNAMKEHGTGVMNLLLGKSPIGISKTAKLKIALSDPRFYSSLQGRSLKSLHDPQIELIHLSVAGLPREAVDILNSFTESNHKVIVAGAGNRNVEISNDGSYQLHNLNAIVVGSIDPNGQVSSYSLPSSNVFILAPSGNYLQTITKEKYMGGIYSTLGKTSGASALVAGTVTDLLSLIPSLTQDEVKIILRKTALPTSNSKHTKRQHGYGTLNDAKVFYVAQRILESKDFEKMSRIERKTFLESYDLYNFGVLSSKLFERGTQNLESPDPETWMTGLDQIRTAFNLNPLPQSQIALIKAYYSKGMTSNAEFYASFTFEARNLDHEEAAQLEARKSDISKPVATSNRR